MPQFFSRLRGKFRGSLLYSSGEYWDERNFDSAGIAAIQLVLPGALIRLTQVCLSPPARNFIPGPTDLYFPLS